MNKRLFLKFIGYLLIGIVIGFIFGISVSICGVKQTFLLFGLAGLTAFLFGLGMSLAQFSEEEK